MALFQCNFISYTLVREVQINVILPTVTCPESMGMGGNKPTHSGKAPYPVLYLLHGFVVRTMAKFQVFHFSYPVNVLIGFCTALAIVAALGNSKVRKPLHTAMTGEWLERLWRKYILN